MLPEFLSIGMPAAEFWHGAPRLAEAYRRASAIDRENRYVAEWRAGVYAYEALAAASGLFREFSKGAEIGYPERPLFGRHARQPDEESQLEAGKARFLAMAQAANRRLAEDGEVPPLE